MGFVVSFPSSDAASQSSQDSNQVLMPSTSSQEINDEAVTAFERLAVASQQSLGFETEVQVTPVPSEGLQEQMPIQPDNQTPPIRRPFRRRNRRNRICRRCGGVRTLRQRRGLVATRGRLRNGHGDHVTRTGPRRRGTGLWRSVRR